MDFPVCPACHQSVIDDDAVDCPFCGASMKAKPGSKPASVASKPTAAVSKPVGPKSAPAKPTLPGDDFPFEAELTTGKSAIPTMPNPTKQRTWKVICPMCDTPGYLPASAAGQEVRCSNPKCVMPVFTAPVPKKKDEAPPPPPSKSSNLPLKIGMTVVLMLAIGGGLYVFNAFPSSKPALKTMSEEDKKLFEGFVGKKKPDPKNPDLKLPSEVGQKAAVDKPAKPEVTAEDLIKIVLKQMKDSCLDNIKQRNKPYCRQLTAEANAVTDHSAAARENLDQLLKVGHEVSYYRINPLLELFWVEFAASDKKAANTLNTAMSEVPKIPKFGRTRLEIAGRLAAALVAGGRMSDASDVLTEIQPAEAETQDAQLAARLQMAMDGKVAPLADSYSVLPWKFPQAVAATASLITRGQIEKSVAWATSQTSDDAKAECLSIWAEEIARQKASVGQVDVDGVIAAAIKSLPPPLAARVWARAGCGRLAAKDQVGAGAAIMLAQEQLAHVSPPEALTMPTMKSTLRFKLPTSAAFLQAATAASEIAYLQAQSKATIVDAEKSLDTAMAFVDATAPSLAAAVERDQEADRLGPALREQLKKALHLKSDDEARTTARNYKSKLNEIVKAAQQRFEIETQLLSRLRGAGVGLNTKVWIVVDSRTTADDINKRDDFFDTSLPGELVEGLKGTDEERAILGAWALRSKGVAPPRPVSVVFNERLQSDVSDAVKYVQTVLPKSTRRDEILLQTASRLATTNKLSTAFEFISELDDVVMREECYRLAASLAAEQGQAETVWKQVAIVQLQTEKIALCRGLIAGLQAE